MRQHPFVHLNGTSRERLTADYQSAALLVDAALRGVAEYATPHPRDYYPLGDDAYSRALREHSLRISRLRAVRDELQEIAEQLTVNNEERQR